MQAGDQVSQVVNEQKDVAGVAAVLRERIALNELPQGMQLRETEIAQDLGVSRQVVRSAFTVLEQKGLVTRIKNKGAHVTKYSYKEIMDLYDIREVLTTMAYQLAARRAPVGAWSELEDLFGSQMDAVVETKDIKTFSDAIVRLDSLVSHYSDNRFIEPIIEPLVDLTQVVARHVMLMPNRLELALKHNRQIIKALEARDEDAVKACFAEMMKASRDYLTQYRELLF